MKEDSLYINELSMLCLVYRLNEDKGRTITKTELIENFNILSYNRDKMINNLISRGLLVNNIEGPRKMGNKFYLSISPKGEQLIVKYIKAMNKLCNKD